MREIKFRAWDKTNKVMCSVWEIGWKAWDEGDPLNYVKVECGDGTYDLLEQQVELMQFSGLLDSKGKEIWEGDLVENNSGKIVVVVFDEEGYWHPFTSGASCGCCGEFTNWYSDQHREVIGTIYEHPELVGK